MRSCLASSPRASSSGPSKRSRAERLLPELPASRDGATPKSGADHLSLLPLLALGAAPTAVSSAQSISARARCTWPVRAS